MITRVWADFRQLADSWQAEAERRRKPVPTDPAADVMDYLAAELREHVRLLESSTEMLGTTEYGQIHGVCPQTVRGWCARGLIPDAINAGGEWRIPRTAPAPVTRQLAKAS